MAPDDELRQTAVAGIAAPHLSREELILEACVIHGRHMLSSQLPPLEGQGYDFLPSFKEMTTQLYLAGVMWRFGEQFDLNTEARDRGFIALMSMLIGDGVSPENAQQRIAHLNQISRTADGQDTSTVAAGYHAAQGDGSLARVFESFRNVPEVSGAPYRILDRAKPIAAILAASGLVLALLFGRSWGEAIGVGVVVGASTIAIALAIYRQMLKAARS